MKVSHFIFRNTLDQELIIIINTYILSVVFHDKDYANTYFTCGTIMIDILSERSTRKRTKTQSERESSASPRYPNCVQCTVMSSLGLNIWFCSEMLLGHSTFHTGED